MEQGRDIGKTASRYIRHAVWLLCALSLAVLLAMRLRSDLLLLDGLVWSAMFNLVCCLVYGHAWKAVARRSPQALPKFFLAFSALRLMAAAAVVLVMCVVMRDDITRLKWSAVLFMAFYLATLLYDAVFFAKVSKKGIQ